MSTRSAADRRAGGLAVLVGLLLGASDLLAAADSGWSPLRVGLLVGATLLLLAGAFLVRRR